MECSRQTEAEEQSTEEPSRHGLTLAKMLAPEEVRPGGFVTLLHEYAEVASFILSGA